MLNTRRQLEYGGKATKFTLKVCSYKLFPARSGIYVASCGTCRAVIGSAAPDGLTVFCDEAFVESVWFHEPIVKSEKSKAEISKAQCQKLRTLFRHVPKVSSVAPSES